MVNFHFLIRVSLSKPHTSNKNGTSVLFTKIYIEYIISIHKSLFQNQEAR